MSALPDIQGAQDSLRTLFSNAIRDLRLGYVPIDEKSAPEVKLNLQQISDDLEIYEKILYGATVADLALYRRKVSIHRAIKTGLQHNYMLDNTQKPPSPRRRHPRDQKTTNL